MTLYSVVLFSGMDAVVQLTNGLLSSIRRIMSMKRTGETIRSSLSPWELYPQKKRTKLTKQSLYIRNPLSMRRDEICRIPESQERDQQLSVYYTSLVDVDPCFVGFSFSSSLWMKRLESMALSCLFQWRTLRTMKTTQNVLYDWIWSLPSDFDANVFEYDSWLHSAEKVFVHSRHVAIL